MKRSRSFVLPVLSLALVAGACSDDPVEPAAEGPSTVLAEAPPSAIGDAAAFQAALDDAAGSARPSTIRLAPGAHIALEAPLVYPGANPLRVRGHGATLVGPDDGNAFEATGGGDLRIEDLTVEGAAEHGIHAIVPADRTGTYSLQLRGVTLAHHGFAGLWVDDQVHGSPAGVDVQIRDSRIVGNNTAGVGEGTDLADLADKDGVRVNEGGPGDLVLDVRDSWFEGNEADGLELDETGPGDVVSSVRRSWFVDNGRQRQFPDDLEDGFDIDEAGEGSIRATFLRVHADGNFDEGLDLDEAGSGDVDLELIRVVASGNADENVAVGEDVELEPLETVDGGLLFPEIPATNTGSLYVRLTQVTANGSVAGDGMAFEEFGVGDLRVTGTGVTVEDNDDEGIQLVEDAGLEDRDPADPSTNAPDFATGELEFTLRRYDAAANDGDGLGVEEYGWGDVRGALVASRIAFSGDDGIQVDQADPGGGLLRLVNVTFDGNDDDDVNSDVEVVRTPPPTP